MTQDDTFNALRRAPLDQVMDKLLSRTGLITYADVGNNQIVLADIPGIEEHLYTQKDAKEWIKNLPLMEGHIILDVAPKTKKWYQFWK